MVGWEETEGGRGGDVREKEAGRKVFLCNTFRTIFEDGYKILHGGDLNKNRKFHDTVTIRKHILFGGDTN